MRSARYWTAEADAAIIAAGCSDGELASRLGRSRRAIRARRWRLTHDRLSSRPTGRPTNRPEDLWKYVAVGAPDECWPWTAATRRRGYGIFTVNRRNFVAHRLAFQVATGIDPGELLVCHTCDNPPCCNPAHLFLGTNSDNMRDMVAKGRDRWSVAT